METHSQIQKKPLAVAKNEGIEQLEAAMLNQQQVDCPVVHRFGPGIYIREVVLPSGIYALGHFQKKDHFNQMLIGKVAVIEEGDVKLLEAPLTFVGKPGRKVGYVLETVVWQNIYPNPTDERDIEKLEAEFLDKSETFEAFSEEYSKLRQKMRIDDREDFLAMACEYGLNPDQIREQAEFEGDQTPMPDEWVSFTAVRDSDIEGKGLFLNWPVTENEIIAPARLGGLRTPAGRYVNHSKTPNCVFAKDSADNIYLIAKRKISGCKGGEHGEELTVDYRQALALSGVYPKGDNN